jgi:hypothetical protein
MIVGNRFYEYGIIGAFFFISQLCGFLIIRQRPAADVQNFVSQFGASLHQVSPELLSSLAAFIGALLIISIFLAGVLIDLAGSANWPFEVKAFCEQLGKNRTWLNDLEIVHTAYIDSEYQNLASNSGGLIKEWSLFRRICIQTQKVVYISRDKKERGELWALLREWPERNARIGALSQLLKHDSQKVYSYLVAFVVVAAGNGKPALLNEQLSIWRTIRGVSTVLVVVGVEILCFPLVRVMTGGDVPWVGFFESYALFFALWFASRWMTRAAYSRVCETLFSLVELYPRKSLVRGREITPSMSQS